MGAALGARVEGLALDRGLDAAAVEQLYAALLEHKVLVVPAPPRHNRSERTPSSTT